MTFAVTGSPIVRITTKSIFNVSKKQKQFPKGKALYFHLVLDLIYIKPINWLDSLKYTMEPFFWIWVYVMRLGRGRIIKTLPQPGHKPREPKRKARILFFINFMLIYRRFPVSTFSYDKRL